MKLSAMGIKIDRLTEEQEAYLKGWGSTTTYWTVAAAPQ